MFSKFRFGTAENELLGVEILTIFAILNDELVFNKVIPNKGRQSPTHEQLSSADAAMGYEVVAPGPAFKPLSEDFVYGDRTTQQGWRNGIQLRDIQSVVVPPLSEQASQSVANRKTPKPLTQDFLYGDRTPETGWSAGIKVQDIQAVNAPAASASERWLTEGFAAKPAKTRTGAPTMQAPATAEDVRGAELAAAPTQAGVRGSVAPTTEAPTSRQLRWH